MAKQNRCPHCGTKLPANAPRGVCPRCLMEAALPDIPNTGFHNPLAIEGPGTKIGHYELLELIGEGGMGLVYLAQQKEPVKRKVAFKIVKLGMDTKEVVARFEAERQTLALLEHPNIAHVFDAGTTDSGRPYFVMEYVEGKSVTKYCDEQKLDVEERLGLFKQVCEGVHHAHQKGIIHRDIKPSNILISIHGDRAVPKIIDFGIAKATTQPLTEKTSYTEQGQLLGTPEYMSPEQAEMAYQDIDTRSDIYSLGVVLYELLAGVTPFDAKRLREGGIDHIQQVICKEEPRTPSVRLTSLGDRAKAVAESRRTQIITLTRRLHRELEWIPMKAMRKDRTRRYRSASELADDIQNYLTGTPLMAGPESTVYRARKFVRKHAGSVATAALLLVVIVLGLVASILMGCKAEQARKQEAVARVEAEQARDKEAALRAEVEQALARAENAERLAEQRRAEAQAVTDFLNNDILKSVQMALAEDREVTGRYVFDAASENIEGKFQDEPLVEASIRETLGLIYFSLGEYKAAEPHLERALKIREEQVGEEYPDTLHSMNRLAWLYGWQNRLDEAEPLFVKALEISRRVLGEEHPDTLAYMGDRAVIYGAQGQNDKAESLLIETLEVSRRVLGEEHSDVLDSMFSLARVYQNQERYDEAERLYVKVQDIRRRKLGEEHLETVRSMFSLAVMYMVEQGRYDEAEPLLIKVLDIRRRKLGEEHPDTVRSMRGLGWLYRSQGRYDESEALYVEALEVSRRVLGEEHTDTLKSMDNLIWLYSKQDRYEEAESLCVRMLERRRRELGEEHPFTVETMKKLIDLYEAWGKPEKAEQWRTKLPRKQTPKE